LTEQQTPPEGTPPQQPPQTPPQQQDTSAQYWQSQADQRANENAQLRRENEQLRQQAQQQQTTPKQQEQQPANQIDWNFKSVYDLYNEQGQMRDDYRKALFRDDVPQEVIDTLAATPYQGQKYIDHATQQMVTDIFGGQEQMQWANEWATENMQQWELQALQAAAQNPFLAKDALKSLRQKAEEGGVDFNYKPNQQQTQQQQTSEPPQMPQGSPEFTGQLTPLVPGSPEAIEATSNPEYMTNPVYQSQVQQRLQLGAKQMPDLTNYMR
jgi:hypothetical protein